MATIIIEQFNPVNGYWNKLDEVDYDKFDPTVPLKDKYGGPHRTRVVGVVEESVEEPEQIKEEVEEEVLEEVDSFFDWKKEED